MPVQLFESCNSSKGVIMEYEKVLFPRLILSFFWTVVLQIFPLFLYIFVTNFDVVHPFEWIVKSTLLVFSIKTWISLVPLQVLLFFLGYVSLEKFKKPPTVIRSRFKLFLSFFTKTNIVKCFIHLLSGIVLSWTYLNFNGVFLWGPCVDSPQSLCVKEKGVFVSACCIWTSFYYFVRYDVLTEKYLQFPIIRQLRFLQIKSKFSATFKNSFKLSVLPVFYFLPFYFWYGKLVTSIFEVFLSGSVDSSHLNKVSGILNISLLVKAWLISSIYISLVEVLQLMIQIHFTERHTFALVKQPNINEILLPAALGEHNVPIIQHLASYDLYILSMSQKSIRWQIFTLSQPGGHPHTWNAILHESLKLIEKFICEVKEIYEVPEPKQPESPRPRHYHPRNMNVKFEEVPLSPKSKLRNLVEYPETYPVHKPQQQHTAIDEFWIKMDSYWETVQNNPVISYIFGSKPDVRIRFLLSNSQPLIWVVQSLSELAANALLEDQFGIVLKDLPQIINTLIRLKFSIDKFGNIQKKFQKQDHDLSMKVSLKSAVKRSLYRIAIAYCHYLTDLPLPPENLKCMQNFVKFKEC